jgi:secretion/DNA translocation related TadE-like protein
MNRLVTRFRGGDEGSATLWLVAFTIVIVMMTTVAVARTAAVAARHRTERAADLTALAAAERIGKATDMCSAATRVASANSARLTSCVVDLDSSGRSGRVSISVVRRVKLPIAGFQLVTAKARAARLPPGTAETATPG